MRFLARYLVWIAILGPPIFLVLAVQHGALTHPFSDYCKLIPLFDRLQGGTLTLSDLFAPLNQNRPATWRALLLANARLTGWDIRSEYVYLLASLVGAFVVQVQLLRRCCAACSPDWQLALVAALSIVSFSPAAHNNHWWSMLIQFDMGHLFIVIAFALVSWRSHDVRDQMLAAVACWLAAYTVTNGLVAFVSCAVAAQLFSPAPQRLNRLTLFWAANLALVLAVYIPGLPANDGGLPSLAQWTVFTFAYVGSPVMALIWFPFQSQFDLPHAASVTARNAAAGAILTIVLAAKAYDIIRGQEKSPAARAFAAFSLFALGSAMLTGLGRAAFGEYGVANANASRFVLFGSYALYACLYAAAAIPSRRPLRTLLREPFPFPRSARIVSTTAALCLLGCATLSYARSWKVYSEARRFDRLLATAYATAEQSSPFDALIYPVADETPGFRAALRRLRVGPYRDAPDADALQRLSKSKLTDEYGINGLRAESGGLILFAHPHARFSIGVSHAMALTFRYGVMPNALNATPPTDGVEFRVLAPDVSADRILWASVWRPESGMPSDQQVTLALPRNNFSGTLIFETLTAGRSDNDWAYWADLAIAGQQ